MNTTAWTAQHLADMDLIDVNGNKAQAYDPRENVAKFETMLDLESLVRMERASEALDPTIDGRERARGNRKDAQAKLFAALDALTPGERDAYALYRR